MCVSTGHLERCVVVGTLVVFGESNNVEDEATKPTWRGDAGNPAKKNANTLKMGIIRPSTSPWAFPVVIDHTPDGTIRLCVDYRKLHSMTKMDAFSVPSMDRMIDKIASAKYITTLNLTKRYWQIPLLTPKMRRNTRIVGSLVSTQTLGTHVPSHEHKQH